MKGSFLIKLLAASGFIAGVALLAQQLAHTALPLLSWMLIPVYGFLTLLLFSLIKGGAAKSPHRFVASVNGAVLIKLFVTAAIVATYLFLGLPGKKAFALSVIGIYGVFTAVLLWGLVPLLRQKRN